MNWCYLNEYKNKLSVVECCLLQVGYNSRFHIVSKSLVFDNITGWYIDFQYGQTCTWTIFCVHPSVMVSYEVLHL